MGQHVFISHAEEDASSARAVCDVLEKHGFRCWLSSRDIPVGTPWDGSIFDAISTAGALVLLFSASANKSPHVRRELALAAEQNLPLMPVRLDATMAFRGLGYYLAGIQWIDATGASPARFDRLVQGLRGLSAAGPASGAQPFAERLPPADRAEPPSAPGKATQQTRGEEPALSFPSRFLVRTDIRLAAVCELNAIGAKGSELAKQALETVQAFVVRAQQEREITWPFGLRVELSLEGNIVRTALKLAVKRLETAGVLSGNLAASLFGKASLTLGSHGGGLAWTLLRDQLGRTRRAENSDEPRIEQLDCTTGARWLLTTDVHQLAVRQLLDTIPNGASGSVTQMEVEGVGVVGAFW